MYSGTIGNWYRLAKPLSHINYYFFGAPFSFQSVGRSVGRSFTLSGLLARNFFSFIILLLLWMCVCCHCYRFIFILCFFRIFLYFERAHTHWVLIVISGAAVVTVFLKTIMLRLMHFAFCILHFTFTPKHRTLFWEKCIENKWLHFAILSTSHLSSNALFKVNTFRLAIW